MVPVNIVTWGTAILPILLLLILMVKFQMGAVKAAPIGLTVSAVGAMVIYRAGTGHIVMEILKGFWSSLTILIVVWTAISLYEVINEARAFQVFRRAMKQLTKNELLQILLLGWVFTSFLQGITGFGVPVAVGAPLLIGIGVQPYWAVIFSLLAHTWGNTFGTLGAAWDALVAQANLSGNPAMLNETALWATFFIWIWNFAAGLMICWFYGKTDAVRKGFPAVLMISCVHGGGQCWMSQWNPTLACFVPCCAAAGVVILLGKSRWYADDWCMEDSPVMDRKPVSEEEGECPENMSVLQAFLPYLVLTVLTLFVLLVEPVKAFLSCVRLGFSFPEMVTGYGFKDEAVELFSPLIPFTHAGLFLLLSTLFGFVYFCKSGFLEFQCGREIWARTRKKTIPSSVSVICFIAMSKVMSGTGQTAVLSGGIAGVLGESYAFLAPVVGLLGSFMTSSNMASNILFGSFQFTTAQLLQLNPALILGAQTAGGAIGAAICPGNIVLGTTTAGISGKEGLLLRKLLPVTLATAAVVGAVVYLLSARIGSA